jgi:hypothetical protein
MTVAANRRFLLNQAKSLKTIETKGLQFGIEKG